MKAKEALTRKIPSSKQKSVANAGNPMDRSHGVVQRPLSIQKGYPNQTIEARSNIRSMSPFNDNHYYNAKAIDLKASKLNKNMHVFSGNDINRIQLGISKKRNTKTALVLKTEVEDNENVESSYHKRNSKMMQGAIENYMTLNTNDIMKSHLKDESSEKTYDSSNPIQNIRMIPKQPQQSIKKIRQMLNKNLNLKQRREVNQTYNADVSRDIRIKNFTSGGSMSPKNRIITSNYRNRNQSELEVESKQPNQREFSSALRRRIGNTIDEDVKNRLNNTLDRFIKGNHRPKIEDPSPKQQILLDKDIEKLYPISSLAKIISGMMDEKSQNLKADSRNEDLETIKTISIQKSIISQKKKSISTNVKTNSNDKSGGSSLMNITDAIAMHSYFSDHESPDSSKNSFINTKPANKYLAPLDCTKEFITFKGDKGDSNLDPRRNESLRKNKINGIPSNSKAVPLPKASVLDNSSASSNSQYKKKIINKKRIKIVTQPKFKKFIAGVGKDSSYVGDDSICKVLSNDTDASCQTNFMYQTAKSEVQSNGDNSYTKKFNDMSSPMFKDMSAMRSDLECIEEEEKKIDQSYELKQSRKEPMRASTNERYRKSLVFGDQTSPDDRIECIAIDDINNLNQYNKQPSINYSKISSNIDDKVCEEFNEIMKRNKQKDKKRMDFDESTNEIIEKSVKRAQKKQINCCQEENLNPNGEQSNNDMDDKSFEYQTPACEIEEFDEDFKSKPKKQKKSNNLLKLISNEDLFQMKNDIMRDIEKGNNRKNSKFAPQAEELKQINKIRNNDNECPNNLSSSDSESGDDNDEVDFENICDGLPIKGNIFHPYIDKNHHQKRYNNNNMSDEEEIVMC